MPLITVKRHKYSMVDITTVISSKHRLRLIDSIKSMVIKIKTTDLKRHRLYPTETHENRRQSTILPKKSFVWVLGFFRLTSPLIGIFDDLLYLSI